jgi:myo-inositol 2-dehydrogenase/D-chiro-inositol 1-dehydrogenase
MIAAARDAGTVLLTAHNARFLPAVAAARDLVAAGRAGEIRAFRCAWGHGGPRGWAPDATWFYERALAGGGALLDLGVHAIDTVRAVTGDDIRAVSAFIGPGNVEQTAQLALRMARGALGTIQASWEIASGADVQLTVQGTDATLHFDLRTPLTLFPVGGGAPARVPLPEQGPTIFDAFVAAVAGTPSPLITAADGRAAVAVVDAAYRSAATGTTVTVV